MSEVERLAHDWERAYRTDMFPEFPDQPEKGARIVWVDPETGEKLSEPFALDQVSASMGRFMSEALQRAIDEDPTFEPVGYRYRPVDGAENVPRNRGGEWEYAPASDAEDMAALAEKGWQVERVYRRTEQEVEGG